MLQLGVPLGHLWTHKFKGLRLVSAQSQPYTGFLFKAKKKTTTSITDRQAALRKTRFTA